MPPFLDTKYRIFWSKMEAVDRIEDIEHAGVRGCLQAMGVDDGIEVNHAGDLPARSGLGSSSTFTVAMLHGLYTLQGRYASKWDLAHEAIRVEQDLLGETVGIQDQIAAAYGGFNLISIDRSGGFSVSPVPMGPQIRAKLGRRLMLVYTGIQRHASEIAAEQVDNFARKEDELHEIATLVPMAVQRLAEEDLDGFGELLHRSWLLKRELSENISNPDIDTLYRVARKNGAIGGKVLGAGGGGFVLLYVPEEKQTAIRAALPNLITIPFGFGWTGSEVVLCAH